MNWGGSTRVFGAGMVLSSLLMQASPLCAQTPLDPVLSQISVGNTSVCALTAAGGVKCWGENGYGQLGNNSNINRSTPVDASGLANGVVAVATGAYHACAVMTTGGLKCWGLNFYGELGNNDNTFADSPVPVTVVDFDFVPIPDAVAVTAGEYHTCALMAGGYVECWGFNGGGQLGNNDPGYYNRSVPVPVLKADNSLLTGVVAIAAGAYHTCALTYLGAMWCWGDNNSGELGNISIESDSVAAVSVADASLRPIGNVTAIATGRYHTCAVTASSGALCWGFNGAGELGNNTYSTVPVYFPASVVDGSNAPATGLATIAGGIQHTCARTTAGGVKCWGYNGYGELGMPGSIARNVPTPVVGAGNLPIAGVAAITTGGFNTCALSTVGGARCWGDDRSGKNGNGVVTSAPAVVLGLAGGTQDVATGEGHTCALTIAGGVECWGRNSSGELGNNSTAPSAKPVAVSGLDSGVTAIAVGWSHACALAAGTVKCWGGNGRGQLGNNNAGLAFSATPVGVVDAGNVPVSGVLAIRAGGDHACALLGGGAVKCWGANSFGQLGNNDATLAPRRAAVSVVDGGNSPITGVMALGAGVTHTCAITAGTGAVCWGENTGGALGNNNPAMTKSLTPVSVVDGGNTPITGLAAIAPGEQFTCARTIAGTAKCWGDGSSGKLGRGSYTFSATPVDVVDAALTPISGVAVIAAGKNHACAALLSGAVQCWGLNDFGQLTGAASLLYNSSNVAIAALNANGSPVGGMATVATGSYHTCTVTKSGAVQCWGNNRNGQVGNGATGELPSAVIGLSGSVAAITTGDSHTCALTPAGTVRCWGYNFFGQLGNNDSSGTNRQVPVTVLDGNNRAVTGRTGLAAGADHTCAITPGGGVECWGDNGNGQLGNNDDTGTNRFTTVAVVDAGGVPVADAVAVTAGAFHSCALTAAGRVLCWGDNGDGQLGNNDSSLVNKYTAVDVVDATNAPITGVTALASGGYFTCGLFTGGAAKCWGDNSKAQLGMGTTGGKSLIPVAVANLGSGVASIAAGVFHACALTVAGAAKCWGYNADGELGDNSMTTRPAPTAVFGLGSGVAKIAAGQFHTCAVSTAGALTCWGGDSKGQLGINVIGGRSLIPVAVTGLGSGVAAAATGGLHTCALTAAGAISCWGNNNAGQLGDNSTTTRPAPVGVLTGQSISFAPPATAAIGTLTLSATASSGLSPTFDSWTPSVCTVSGNKVTVSAYGLCGVRAAQGGNGSTIAAAPRQSRLIVISNEIFSSGFE